MATPWLNEHSWAQARRFLDSWLRFHAREDDLPGFTVAIYHDGHLAFSGAYGYADVGAMRKMTPSARFCIGSQSKMVTAVAIMQLVEQGKLRLETPVYTYLPWLNCHPDKRFHQITLRELLWHGAGIVRDGEAADFWQLACPFPGSEELKRMVLKSRMVLDRSVQQKYSNIGYALLGQVIEAVSGEGYADYVRREIQEPAGWNSILGSIGPLATGYMQPVHRRRCDLPKDVPTAAMTPATGLIATAEEMCYFLAAQMPGCTTLLKQNVSKRELHAGRRNHWLPDAMRGTEYGSGFMKYTFGGLSYIGHSGAFVGHISASCFNADRGLAVAVCANAQDAPAELMMEGVVSVLDYFAENAVQPLPKNQEQLNIRLMNLWSTVELVATKDKLVMIYPAEWLPFQDPPEELVADGPDTFLIQSGNSLNYHGEKLALLRDETGRIAKIRHGGDSLWPEGIYLKILQQKQAAHPTSPV